MQFTNWNCSLKVILASMLPKSEFLVNGLEYISSRGSMYVMQCIRLLKAPLKISVSCLPHLLNSKRKILPGLFFCVAPNKILNVKNFKKSETRAKNFTFRHFRNQCLVYKYLPKISKFKYSFFFTKPKGFLNT